METEKNTFLIFLKKNGENKKIKQSNYLKNINNTNKLINFLTRQQQQHFQLLFQDFYQFLALKIF